MTWMMSSRGVMIETTEAFAPSGWGDVQNVRNELCRDAMR